MKTLRLETTAPFQGLPELVADKEGLFEKEGIKVTEQEITQRILVIAQQNDIKPDKLVKQLQDRDGVAEIHEQILTSKVLDFLELHAQVEEISAAQPAQATSQA